MSTLGEGVTATGRTTHTLSLPGRAAMVAGAYGLDRRAAAEILLSQPTLRVFASRTERTAAGTPVPRTVRAVTFEGNVYCECDCPAGGHGQPCWHVDQFLSEHDVLRQVAAGRRLS